MDLDPEIMTSYEVAAYLRVSRTTVIRLLKRRNLPGFRIGVDYRFRRADIDEWVEAREKAREKP